MPGSTFCTRPQVDVAVDLADVVLGPRDVVLDQGAALEHGDLGGLGAHVHAHEVAADRPALALAAPPALERLLVDRSWAAGLDRGTRRPLPPAPPPPLAPASPAAAPASARRRLGSSAVSTRRGPACRRSGAWGRGARAGCRPTPGPARPPSGRSGRSPSPAAWRPASRPTLVRWPPACTPAARLREPRRRRRLASRGRCSLRACCALPSVGVRARARLAGRGIGHRDVPFSLARAPTACGATVSRPGWVPPGAVALNPLVGPADPGRLERRVERPQQLVRAGRKPGGGRASSADERRPSGRHRGCGWRAARRR